MKSLKAFLKSTKPSIGLNLLKDLEVIEVFPELRSLINCPQDKSIILKEMFGFIF